MAPSSSSNWRRFLAPSPAEIPRMTASGAAMATIGVAICPNDRNVHQSTTDERRNRDQRKKTTVTMRNNGTRIPADQAM
jgi:hypothetical protein